MTATTSAPVPNIWCNWAPAAIAIPGLIFIKHVNNPFGRGPSLGADGFPWWIVWPLTIFWFMGMMNTINFLDGASGLVTGVTAILSRRAGHPHDLQGRAAPIDAWPCCRWP